MGGIYHKGQPYSRQMVVDTALSAVSNNPLKNRAVTGLVDDVIAPVEGANASQNYAAGDELILNNLLYKAKSAINQDTPFDAGSSGNIELAGSIAEQLKSLFADEDLLRKTYIDGAQYGHISDCNITFADAFGSSDPKDAGIKFYTVNNPAHAPYNSFGLAYLIHIGYYPKYQMQILLKDDLSIFIRGQHNTDWPTSAVSYGWTQIRGISKAYTDITTTDTDITIASTAKYMVKDGICFGQISYSIADTSNHDGACQLPKPGIGSGYLYYRAIGTETTGDVRIAYNGSVRLSANAANKVVIASFSYPVADS